MRHLSVLIGLSLLATVAAAESEPQTESPSVPPAPSAVTSDTLTDTVSRGVTFLQADAERWRDAHHCASCHHAALTVWSLQSARQAGYPIDVPLMQELTDWLAEAGDGRTSLTRPATAPRAFNTKAVYFALGLAALPDLSETGRTALARLRSTVISDQIADGSWVAWPETRAPLFGDSNASMTALATLALLPVSEKAPVTEKAPPTEKDSVTDNGPVTDEQNVAAEDNPETRTALDRAVRWLAAAPPDGETESLALRLLVWERLHRPQTERQPLIQSLLTLQRPDGGWGQTVALASDAFATGQALTALGASQDPQVKEAIARGQRFLIRTQRPDGSWPMTSRPTKPSGEGAKTLVPIIGAGSAWAVLGLTSNSLLSKPLSKDLSMTSNDTPSDQSQVPASRRSPPAAPATPPPPPLPVSQ